jgi:hypothetical protein
MVEFAPFVVAKTKRLVISFSSVDSPFTFGSWLKIDLGFLTLTSPLGMYSKTLRSGGHPSPLPTMVGGNPSPPSSCLSLGSFERSGMLGLSTM